MAGLMLETALSSQEIDIYIKVQNIGNQVAALKKQVLEAVPDKKGKIFDLPTAIAKWTKLVTTAQKIITDATGLLSIGVDVTDRVIEIVLKQLQIYLLEVKKSILLLQKRIEEAIKDSIENTLKCKGSLDISLIIVPVTIYQTISIIINVVQQLITLLCNLFVFPIAVAAEGLSFFMTPKSLVTTEMKIINALQCGVDNLPEIVKKAIDAICWAVEVANNTIRLANIAAGAANAASLIASGSPLITQLNFCPKFSKIDTTIIFKAVNLLLNLQIFALPLPRFEKLHLLNLGYVTWLLTGYEPAAKKTFGIPGMP